MYIYIYIYTYIHTYIYICVYNTNIRNEQEAHHTHTTHTHTHTRNDTLACARVPFSGTVYDAATLQPVRLAPACTCAPRDSTEFCNDESE